MGRGVNPYLISVVVSLAAFMEILDSTIVNVALTDIVGSLGAGTDESTWVITSYLVSNAIVLPLSGWLSARMGRKNFFISCILGFTAASFLCGIAVSLSMIIVCRLIQGLAGGGLQPSQQAIIRDIFPKEKMGMAFAITGITTILAPVIGPVAGGYITDNFDWRWIFFINVPIGLAAAFLSHLLLQDPPGMKREKSSVDYIGLGLVSVGIGALQLVLDKGQEEDWFSSNFIVTLSCISAVGLISAAFWLLKQKDPIINLKLFRFRSFSMPCMVLFFVGFALYSGTALMPMMVQQDFGYDRTLSGLVLSPAGLVIIFIMPIVGMLVNRIQARYLILFGLLVSAAGMWMTSLVTPQTDYMTFVCMRIAQMIGVPFLFVSASTLAFSRISAEDNSNASAILTFMRNIGGSIGIAVVMNKMVSSEQTEQAHLVSHLTAADPGYQSAVGQYTSVMMHMGDSQVQALSAAWGKIYQQLVYQAGILAYRDAYEFIAAVLLCVAAIAVFTPGNELYKKEKTEKSGT